MASELETQWIEEYLETGDHILATEKIYPNTGLNAKDKDDQVKKRSAQLKAKLSREIDARSRELYGRDAPVMMNRLKHLALKAESEAVSAKCCADWLSRAGHDAAHVIEIKDQRTEQELLDKLAQQLDKLDKETISKLPSHILDKVNHLQETKH